VTACQLVKQGDWYSDVLHRFCGQGPCPDRARPVERWHHRLAASPGQPYHPAGQGPVGCGRVYKPTRFFDGTRWLLWYNGRRGGVEQIGVAIHEGEDLGF
jgi:beta-1,2-mannobiose phosphorylase / 1,2-beta-oligomannan phosphorylase